MNRTLRTFVTLGGLAALAASSQATIVFTPLTSDMSTSPSATNQISATPPQLSMFPHGTGTVTDTGSCLLTDSSKIGLLTVNEVDGYALGATVSLAVTLYNGNSTSDPVLETLYSQSATNGRLSPVSVSDPVDLIGTHAISFTATYVGSSTPIVGYLGAFSIDAYQAVPEPAAYATFGIGIMGLLVRRRRSGK